MCECKKDRALSTLPVSLLGVCYYTAPKSVRMRHTIAKSHAYKHHMMRTISQRLCVRVRDVIQQEKEMNIEAIEVLEHQF